MSRRYNDWQNANNPNMAPLPSRGGPRGGIGSNPTSTTIPDQPPHLSSSSPQQTSSISTSTSASSNPNTNANAGMTAEVATTLFIGSISQGVTDEELKSLLEACGKLSNLNRVSKAFGFATFKEPDDVIRALIVLNGRELPAFDPTGKDKDPKAKKLNVKADEKTRKFLDQYEQTLIKTDQDEEKQKTASTMVDSIITKMADPSNRSKTQSSNQVEVPAHLRDLTEEELPEEHRGSVLSEIDKFRQTSQVREEDKRRREMEMERIKAEERREKAMLERKKAQDQSNDPTAAGPKGTKINGFVPSSSSNQTEGKGTPNGKEEKDLEPEERDEVEERKRKERKKTESIGQGKEAERSYLHAERARLAHFNRLEESAKKEKNIEESRRNGILKRSEAYSSGKLDEYEEELFWVNRSEWRIQRKKTLSKEREQDSKDREMEEKEMARAREEMERFLKQQEEELRALQEEQRRSGILVQKEGASEPLKMKFNLNPSSSSAASGSSSSTNQLSGNPSAAAASSTAAAAAAANAAAKNLPLAKPVLGEAVEDDLTKTKRGKLTNIQLGDGLTPEQREEKRKESVRKIEKELPSERGDLFNMNPKWDWVDEITIQNQYRNQLDQAIEESIGEKVPELTEAVVEKLRSRSQAAEIVEVLEPVLAEESAAFVEHLWRTVLVDSLVSAAGLRA